jgi:hypothetical protein
MEINTPPAAESADQLISRLARMCECAGLVASIVEPSTKLRISTPNGNEHLAETITLRPDADDVLMWWWSWGRPICPACDIDFAVSSLIRVVAGTRA